ncbi:MAG: hypothetical protein QM537_08730, partial [Candidatus Symbiobacter sp.]|nr:hypothetical protein [Candidatus Symbiobacter sp.]
SNPEKSSNFKMLLDCFAGEAARSQMPFLLFLGLVRSILREEGAESEFSKTRGYKNDCNLKKFLLCSYISQVGFTN